MPAAIPPAVLTRYRSIEEARLPETIPELLLRAEGLYGDALAVDFFERGQSMTYAQLARTSRALASGLSAAGFRKGDHVAVLLPNRIEFAVVWLALAEIGAVVVPIVLGSTGREILYFVEDGDVTGLVVEAGVLAQRGLAPGLDGMPEAARTVVVDGGDGDCLSYEGLARMGDPCFQADDPPVRSDLLSIQYTSGTTGLPKGAMLDHRFWIVTGVVPMLMWGMDFRTILSDHPFFYIDPQWMLVAGLYAGARVDFTERMSVRKFVGWLTDRRTEITWFADPVLKNEADPAEANNAVKLFLGYEMGPAMVEETRRRFGAPTRECYGMTEIGVGLAVPLEVDDPEAAATCGIPAPFRRCRIVDADGADMVDGGAGELLIGGDGILRGYYKRAEANAEVLVDGWFRTGDLFVRDPNGFYRIVGRLKDMVRRSGESIAAAEVERVLLEMPEIVDAAVVPVPDEARGEEVKAYLALRDGTGALDPRIVLDHCGRRLAKFKHPRFIAFVDSLPHTPSDKVAKHVLVKDVADLRTGAYDAVDGIWR